MATASHAAFTICSNNYLGQALALKRSLLKHNPEMSFFVILVDERSPAVDYAEFDPATVIPVDEIPTIDLQDLLVRYYIIELNTSVKPTVFKYLKDTHPQIEKLYYLDPDLYFYESLSDTNTLLNEGSAVLTPHILSPIPRDGKQPEENTFLRFGIYNLGFLGLNMNHAETRSMLDWWEERVIRFGYDRPNKGYFVDQLWMAHAPLFYKDVRVLTTYNYNMAPWNLHERQVAEIEDGAIVLNDGTELVFYHFSKLSDDENAVSREYDRFTFQDFPLLKKIYAEYRDELRSCHYSEYKKIPIAFPVKMSLAPEPVKDNFISKIARKVAHRLLKYANRKR